MSAKPKASAKLPDRENLREILAYNIQTLRVQKGWSQERLANECELDRTYVGIVDKIVAEPSKTMPSGQNSC